MEKEKERVKVHEKRAKEKQRIEHRSSIVLNLLTFIKTSHVIHLFVNDNRYKIELCT